MKILHIYNQDFKLNFGTVNVLSTSTDLSKFTTVKRLTLCFSTTRNRSFENDLYIYQCLIYWVPTNITKKGVGVFYKLESI